jgi:hypothetical protein
VSNLEEHAKKAVNWFSFSILSGILLTMSYTVIQNLKNLENWSLCRSTTEERVKELVVPSSIDIGCSD